MLFGLLPSKSSTKNYDDFVANDIPDEYLSGKTVVITGCTSGTGLIAAKTAARKGASHVLMLNRPSSRAQAALQEVQQLVEDDNNKDSKTVVQHIDCDLQDFESVRRAAHQISSAYETIDVLANNAGIMAMEDTATKDGYDVQMQTNHLSHFLLTKELMPLLRASAGTARIVNHSSMARNGGPLEARYFQKKGGDLGGNSDSMFAKEGKWERYHQTKLANATFTAALDARLRAAGIDNVKALCAAPGLAATSLQHTSTGMSGDSLMMMLAQSAEDGALGLLACMFLPDDGDNAVVKGGTLREPWNGLYGKPVEKPMDKPSLDQEQQDMLWKESEAAVGKFDLSSS